MISSGTHQVPNAHSAKEKPSTKLAVAHTAGISPGESEIPGAG